MTASGPQPVPLPPDLEVMTRRRDVLIAVVTTIATIIVACIVLVAIILLAIVLTDRSPIKKPDRPPVTPTSTAPLPL
jgi:hypothetical protein